MDVASKIKQLKDEIAKDDEVISHAQARIKELKGLVEMKKQKQSQIDALLKQEEELLASL